MRFLNGFVSTFTYSSNELLIGYGIDLSMLYVIGIHRRVKAMEGRN